MTDKKNTEDKKVVDDKLKERVVEKLIQENR